MGFRSDKGFSSKLILISLPFACFNFTLKQAKGIPRTFKFNKQIFTKFFVELKSYLRYGNG